jgi:hypothetical protein
VVFRHQHLALARQYLRASERILRPYTGNLRFFAEKMGGAQQALYFLLHPNQLRAIAQWYVFCIHTPRFPPFMTLTWAGIAGKYGTNRFIDVT